MSPDYMTIEGCNQKHQETLGLLREINDRLYKDNGSKSIQTRLNEHEGFILSMRKALWIIAGALLIALVAGAIAVARHIILMGG